MCVLIFILGFSSAGPFGACSELTTFCMHLNCHLFLFSIFSLDPRLFFGLQMLEADSTEACPDYSLFSIYHQFGSSPLVPQALSWKKWIPWFWPVRHLCMPRLQPSSNVCLWSSVISGIYNLNLWHVSGPHILDQKPPFTAMLGPLEDLHMLHLNPN